MCEIYVNRNCVRGIIVLANDATRRYLNTKRAHNGQVEALMEQVRSYSGTGQAANRNNKRYYPIVRPIAGRRT